MISVRHSKGRTDAYDRSQKKLEKEGGTFDAIYTAEKSESSSLDIHELRGAGAQNVGKSGT